MRKMILRKFKYFHGRKALSEEMMERLVNELKLSLRTSTVHRCLFLFPMKNDGMLSSKWRTKLFGIY